MPTARPHFAAHPRPPVVRAALLLAGLVAAAAHAQTGWQTVATEPTCTARHEAALTAVKGRLYLLGGRGVKPVEEFDPQTRAWRKLARTPMEMNHFQAFPVGERIAVVGAMTGRFPKEDSVPNVWWFDPLKDEWTQGPALPAGRARGGAGAVLLDGKIYLIGGNTNGHWNGFVAWADVLDLQTGRWTALPDAPHPRDHFQAVVIDGRIVAAGGRTTFAQNNHTFDLTVPEVDVFDPTTQQWTSLPAKLPTPRAGCMAVARDGKAIVIGGECGKQTVAHVEVEALTLATGAWETLPALKQGRHGSGAAFVDDDLYVASGCAHRGGSPEIHSVEKLPWPPLPATAAPAPAESRAP